MEMTGVEMWKQLKNISHHYEFQYPPKRDDAVNMLWKQVRHKLPAAKLSVHRNRRLKIPDWWISNACLLLVGVEWFALNFYAMFLQKLDSVV
ncbi:hypothetical protein ACLOJK_014498 [Asimina triloba]